MISCSFVLIIHLRVDELWHPIGGLYEEEIFENFSHLQLQMITKLLSNAVVAYSTSHWIALQHLSKNNMLPIVLA